MCASKIYSVRANASKVSQLMRDEILPGKEVAVYWIEYVIRHRGTKHLQLATNDLPIHKLYLIDVVLFMITLLLVACFVTIRIIRFGLQRCFHPKKEHKPKRN